ncbi:MAG: DUF177 domain-containing protein [Croceibacterium sp.]
MADVNRLPAKTMSLSADAAEREALARRFGIVAIKRLEARVTFTTTGDRIDARGRLDAALVQSCAVSGEELPVTIAERLDLRFVPERPVEADEMELQEGELDEIPFAGEAFDLGEAVAQSLALAIDPYAVGPQAERVRRKVGLLDEATAGPFGALAALKKG